MDPRISPTSIIFTNKSTTIGEDKSNPLESSLKIQIIPRNDGKNIASIHVRYFDPDQHPSRISEDILDKDIFTSVAYSINGDDDTMVDKVHSYMRAIPKDDAIVILKEYAKYIDDGVIIDGFIGGLGAYIAFLVLNQNGAFANQMPFQFGVPTSVESGNAVNRNMFSYLSLPLMALSRCATGILLQLVLFIQSFINIWDPLFSLGPTIGSSNEARLCVEIISGYSNYISSTMTKAQADYDNMITQVKIIKTKLHDDVDTAIRKMRREINNLLIETKSTIKELSQDVNSQIANKVSSAITDQVRDIIRNEITISTANIVTDHEEIKSRIAKFEHGISSITSIKKDEQPKQCPPPPRIKHNFKTTFPIKTWNKKIN